VQDLNGRSRKQDLTNNSCCRDIAAGLYLQQCPNKSWEDKVKRITDEHGCRRPVSLWGNDSQGVAMYFSDRPSSDDIDFLRERALLFTLDRRDGVSGPDGVEVHGFELLERKVITTKLDTFVPMKIDDVKSNG